jgi:putative Holliday junction resolvase
MIGRVLGIDHGDVHTGLAVSDPLGITAQPLRAIHEKDLARAATLVAAAAREANVVVLVVGLPLNMNGTEGPRAGRARAFGAELERLLALPVQYWDERLTTVQAGAVLRGRGGERRKAGIDVVSAQLMLQCFLDAASRRAALETGGDGGTGRGRPPRA